MSVTTINPATGEALATYELMDTGRCVAMVAAAQAAYADWSRRDVSERVSLLPELAAVLRRNSDRYSELMSLEMGKTITEARGEVEKCAWLCEMYAEKSAKWLAEHEIDADGLRHRVVYQPLGVVLSIMPWNYPFWQALRFGVPTLAAGNTSILKHASNVTGCGLAIAEAFTEAGFPDGAFQTVVADHAAVAEIIARDEIRGVSLTGSTEVGARIAALAGEHLKKVVLELGGSDPFIVLADADIEAAAAAAVTGRMLCTGQSCIAAKRFIVQREVAAAFSARFAELMAGLRVGDPLDPETQVGAIVNDKEMVTLTDQLNDAVQQGAQVLAGGGRLERKGCFFAPTVLSGVTPRMRVAREEVFGPIAPVIVVDDEDEAVRVANNSEFGLGASVWTRELTRGEDIARRLEVGTAFVNNIVKSDPRMPFGGVKKSGLGRELAWFGLREFTNIKGLSIYAAD